MSIRSTVVLTERQRGILQVALEIARDKFLENVRALGNNHFGLADQFEQQAKEAEVLLNQVTLADEITITEEV